MSRIDASTTAAAPATASGSSFQDLDLDVFLELMLAELQNQDPLDPTDNAELLNTINQIREISSNDRLTETLDSVLLGQNVATATSLIGTEIEGVSESGQPVTGAVQRVTINDGAPMLDVAVATRAEAADREGDVAAGRYGYEVVWETDDATFSVQVAVNTDDLGEDFTGSIRLENLPETSVPKKVYRTDRSGSGDLQLVGQLPSGRSTSFVDTFGDDDLRQERLTGSRQVIRFADAITVPLDSVRNVQTQ